MGQQNNGFVVRVTTATQQRVSLHAAGALSLGSLAM